MKVISKVIDSVDFSFYNEHEVHAVSVKHITNPVLLDALRNPVPGGLYDQALGPLDRHASCARCGQQSMQCPGHCGHIDLVLPVFNPLVYRMMIKIYRTTCIYCHHFKMHKDKVARYGSQLELIAQGRMVEASTIIPNAKIQKSEEDGPAEDENTVSEVEDAIQGNGEVLGHEEANGLQDISGSNFTSSQMDAAKEAIDQFLASIPKVKCENCAAFVPAVRSEGVGKLFQKPLSGKHLSSNIDRGIKSDSILPSWREDLSSGDLANAEAGEVSGDPNALEQTILTQDASHIPNKEKFVTPSEVRGHLRRTWENEERICSLIWGVEKTIYPPLQKSQQQRNTAGFEMFFLQSILVTPNRFRPPNILNDAILEHPQNVFYTKVIQTNLSLVEASRGKRGEDGSIAPVDLKRAISLWLDLQNCVNGLLDSTTAIGTRADQGSGIRQLLEKKEGLFRMNMMGKRVNYACRSVISPDPYISVNEIGIPPYFATRLTYPERVTHYNAHLLREAVENGPTIHPGATHVEDEHGVVTNLHRLPAHKRAAIAKTLLSSSNPSSGTNLGEPRLVGKTVLRHLRTGDILLVNRQPTLHKPGIMGHRARILTGEKTLRMHYANCSTYNADFDGDEMNVHFPQDDLGRAEGYHIVNADEQFVVPTSGNPIRGLIQDHVVSGVLLTKRDTFLTKEMYQQLVYAACVSAKGPIFKRKKTLIGLVEPDPDILPVPPAILKPQPLWTGKQVMTTVFNYITHGNPPFSMSAGGKVPKEYWGRGNGEDIVVFRDNEMICGVIDKAQFGKYGLVHAFQELYGCAKAGRLLSVFSRLFTAFLQMHGFTCGIGDLLLLRKSEKARRRKLSAADKVGDNVYARFTGAKEGVNLGSVKSEVERTLRAKGESASNRLDRMMAGDLNGVTSDVNNSLLPGGLQKPFPGNCFLLMTSSGAKGGLVNFTQISCLLGQQELEGKRVPRMPSGKTLPCFSPWDSAARSGGFIGDRFLTGLRPQEYYFHCMAGRDGLVDTAVKTSRSGYLQRCLMKNLEGLRVHYDYTVRDSDGSIVQFKYGEDGIDVLKTSYLTKFDLLAENQALVSRKLGRDDLRTESQKQSRAAKDELFSDAFHGTISEAFDGEVKRFMRELPKKSLKRLKLKKRRHAEEFSFLMQLKFISSLVPPGEPVGVLAAQSVGEPSTQMTLNTFHFAGRGEMNVTLGIPRLREILMTASENISTPIMTCPLMWGTTREDAERLATQLRRLRLVDIVEKLDVGEVPFLVTQGMGVPLRIYKIRLKFYSPERFPPHFGLSLGEVEAIIRKKAFEKKLYMKLEKVVKGSSKKGAAIKKLPFSKLGEYVGESAVEVDDEGNPTEGVKESQDVDIGEPDEAIDDEEDADEGADAEKRRGQGTDEREYNDEEDDEEKVIAKNLQDVDGYLSGDDNEKADHSMDEGHSPSVAKAGVPEKSTTPSSVAKVSKKLKSEDDSDDDESKLHVEVHGSTIEIHLPFPQDTPLIMMHEVIEKLIKEVNIREVKGIEKCSVIEWKKDPRSQNGQIRLALQTDGVNFEGLQTLQDDLDIRQLETNNIALMLKQYGVEAARSMILSEVKEVFDAYGIQVNRRHLSLISDFMTCQGQYRPCNRIGISSSPSPFLKMSYETATTFLVDATLKGQTDRLESPSARIVMGRVVEAGTGSFDLFQNIDSLIESKGAV